MNLTPKQKQTLIFINKFYDKKGYMPSLRELGRYFGLLSFASMQDKVNRLIVKGYLIRESNRARGIEITDKGRKYLTNLNTKHMSDLHIYIHVVPETGKVTKRFLRIKSKTAKKKRGAKRKRKVTLVCKQCGRNYRASVSQVKRGRQFCSMKCRGDSMRGKTISQFRTPESIEKRLIALRQNKKTKVNKKKKRTVKRVKCLLCNKKFKQNRTNRKFCSRFCAVKYHSLKGRFSKEQKSPTLEKEPKGSFFTRREI